MLYKWINKFFKKESFKPEVNIGRSISAGEYINDALMDEIKKSAEDICTILRIPTCTIKLYKYIYVTENGGRYTNTIKDIPQIDQYRPGVHGMFGDEIFVSINIMDDAEFYTKEEIIRIIAHELRHIYQEYTYSKEFIMQNHVSGSDEQEWITNILEIDADAFAEYYLQKYSSISETICPHAYWDIEYNHEHDNGERERAIELIKAGKKYLYEPKLEEKR